MLTTVFNEYRKLSTGEEDNRRALGPCGIYVGGCRAADHRVRARRGRRDGPGAADSGRTWTSFVTVTCGRDAS